MISDDTLTLYFYEDGLSDEERQDVEDALAQDTVLATRYAALTDDLAKLGVIPGKPAPAEAVVRWRSELDKVVDMQMRGRAPRLLTWLLPAAAALVLGIAIGMNLTQTPDGDSGPLVATAPLETPVTAPEASPPSMALTRGVTSYMRESRLQLVSLQDSDADNRIELITQIIEQNRLFERAADASDAPEIARVLRGFEQMLLELARQEAAPRDISEKSDQLSFEYAVMLTKLARDASHKQTSL